MDIEFVQVHAVIMLCVRHCAVQNLEDNALQVDTALSTTSENPVQNKAVKAAIDEVAALYELVSATDAEGWFTTSTP